MLIIAAVAWGIAALGALDLSTRRSDGVDLNAILCIVVVAGVLMALAHVIPGMAAILVACVLASHAALIAAAIIADAFRRQPRSPAARPPTYLGAPRRAYFVVAK